MLPNKNNRQENDITLYYSNNSYSIKLVEINKTVFEQNKEFLIMIIKPSSLYNHETSQTLM